MTHVILIKPLLLFMIVRSSNWVPGARLNHEPDRVQVYLRVPRLPGKVYLLLHAYDSSSLHGKHKVCDRLGSERGSKERVIRKKNQFLLTSFTPHVQADILTNLLFPLTWTTIKLVSNIILFWFSLNTTFGENSRLQSDRRWGKFEIT